MTDDGAGSADGAEPSTPTTYRALLRLPGVGRLFAAMLLSRCAGYAFAVALVLFVLVEYHSIALTGFCAFLSEAPGLVVSPVMGALLDRGARARLASLDYMVSAATLALVSGLSCAHALPSPLLLVLVGAASLTSPLSWSGMRAALPSLVPRELWDRANAVDLTTQEVASTAGPALAGGLMAAVGGQLTMLVIAVAFVLAAVFLWGLEVPASQRVHGGVLAEAWGGMRHLWENRTLRGLAISASIAHVCDGTLILCVPLIVLNRLHQSTAIVGICWAAYGLCGMSAGLLLGKRRIERWGLTMYAAGMLITGAGAGIAALSSTLPLLLLAMAVFGIGAGSLTLALLSLRQRSTEPRMLGRVIATSMALNFSGLPVGSALAGLIAGRSIAGALAVGVLCTVIGALAAVVIVPRRA